MYSAVGLTVFVCLPLLTLCMPSNGVHMNNFENSGPIAPAATCQADQNFGYVLLAIQWAPSFCNATKCGTRNRNSWTIHGAWPQHTNNSWPQNCCFESTFNVSKIQSLETQLLDKWPSLKASGSHQDFWKHEWTKHGTCAMVSNQLKGHYNYFKRTLDLYNSFPLQSWLKTAGIVASNTTAYSLTKIHGVVESNLGARVELECLSKQPYPLLQHIYICLDKDTLKPIKCTRADDKQCGTTNVRIPLA